MAQDISASAAATAPTTFSQFDLDRARTEGVEQGAATERARVAGILGHATADCSPVARQCIQTGLTAEQANAILDAAAQPVVTVAQAVAAATPATDFAAHMERLGNPQVSGIEAAETPQQSEARIAAELVTLHHA